MEKINRQMVVDVHDEAEKLAKWMFENKEVLFITNVNYYNVLDLVDKNSSSRQALVGWKLSEIFSKLNKLYPQVDGFSLGFTLASFTYANLNKLSLKTNTNEINDDDKHIDKLDSAQDADLEGPID